jgi:16S rRNA (uracil1498-N3)-methyltransferase
MRRSRVFTAQPLATNIQVVLDGPTCHYLKHVLRLSVGTPLALFNGLGGEYSGQVTEIGRSTIAVALDMFSPQDRASPLRISLGLCITKRDAMDSAIQMATELGVTDIYPLISAHTTVPRQAQDKREGHWQQIIYSACEQCGLNRPPRLYPVGPLDLWLKDIQADLKIIADASGSTRLLEIASAPTHIAVAIGPEGGFTPDELAMAEAAEFLMAGLGPRIIRAAHMPAALIGVLQTRFGDLQTGIEGHLIDL